MPDLLPPVMIRPMRSADSEALAELFAAWHKSSEQFERYYLEQLQEQRLVLVAQYPTVGQVGYVTIVWESQYEQFWRRNIPEIVDLNVMTPFQKQGVGTALLHACEEQAGQRGYRTLGISVVQSADYAPAERLYRALGYVADGFGVTPHDNELHLIKTLAKP
jgi:GNAT superfamily N-acetyltransferase